MKLTLDVIALFTGSNLIITLLQILGNIKMTQALTDLQTQVTALATAATAVESTVANTTTDAELTPITQQIQGIVTALTALTTPPVTPPAA